MGIEQGYEMLTQSLVNLWTFDIYWVIPLILATLTMAVITRDVQKWKILALPVLTGYHIIGIKTSILFLMIASITFVIETLSLQVLGALLQTVSKKATITTSNILHGGGSFLGQIQTAGKTALKTRDVKATELNIDKEGKLLGFEKEISIKKGKTKKEKIQTLKEIAKVPISPLTKRKTKFQIAEEKKGLAILKNLTKQAGLREKTNRLMVSGQKEIAQFKEKSMAKVQKSKLAAESRARRLKNIETFVNSMVFQGSQLTKKQLRKIATERLFPKKKKK